MRCIVDHIRHGRPAEMRGKRRWTAAALDYALEPFGRMLLCTVRNCGQSLVREGSRWVCERGHSYDVSRYGYVNLLQPQDKRSRKPGDRAEAVAARRRLHERGISQPLLEGLAEMLPIDSGQSLLDVGCGDGFYLGNLAARFGADGWGVDLSVPAVQAAARRYVECHWLVANADRSLPYVTGGFGAVMSITARLHPEEFRRVLTQGGWLLVAVPGPEDLVELRGVGKDRTVRVAEMLAPFFAMEAQRRISCTADLDADAVRDVQLAIYRPLQAEMPPAMRLSFSLDALLLRARG